MPQIEVKFDIDQNGILNVSARDLGTGKEANVRIKESSGLSENEVERMRKDAENTPRTIAASSSWSTRGTRRTKMCYQLEKMMKEHGDKLTDGDKDPGSGDRKGSRARPRAKIPQAIKSAVKELEQASHAVSKAMYESPAAAKRRATSGRRTTEGDSRRGSDDDAIDAEFEVKND